MAGRDGFDDVSSSQEREADFLAKIRKLRRELEETKRMKKEGLEKRGKTGGATGGVDEVREVGNPGNQTAGYQKEDTGESHVLEEWSKERARGERGTREEGRWRKMFEGEVEKEVSRRKRARETSRDMIDETDELASNPQHQEQHRERRAQDIYHQPEQRRNMGRRRERSVSLRGRGMGGGRGRIGQAFVLLLPRRLAE